MAFGDLFDSPWKVLIIAVVVLVLFGSRKMPDAARSLGRSMRILKSEIKDMHEDGADGTQGSQQAQPQPAQQLTAAVGTPPASVPVTPPASVPVTPADGGGVAPAPPPASMPVSAEVQQDTRPA
jgi:sec-independent protein translocase protein TatA